MADYSLSVKITGDSKGYKVAVEDARKSTKSFGDDSVSLGKKLSSGLATGLKVAAKASAVASAAIGTGMVAAIKTGSEFESQMSRVQAISGATAKEFQALRDQAIQLGADTAFSATSAAEGMENLAAAGFETKEIMDAMPGLLDLAAASGEDLASSSDIAASTLRGFGLAASDAGHVADVLAENANRTNSSVHETGEAMKYIAPLARAAGISMEETAAAIGIMANAGIQGSQAGTTLRGALSRLSKPTDAMVTAMQNLGVSFYDSSGKMKPLATQVNELKTAMEGMTDEQKNQYLVTLYGQEALSGMLALINEGGDSLTELTNSFKNCDGAASEAAAVMQDNFAGAMEQLKGSTETLGIRIFDSISEPLKNLANSATDAVNDLTAAFQKNGFSGLAQAGMDIIGNFLQGLVSKVPDLLQAGADLINSLLDSLSTSPERAFGIAGVLINKFGEGFVAAIPEFLPKVLDFIQGLGDKLAEAAPVIIQKGFELLGYLVDGIVAAVPILIEKVPGIISTFANIINDNFPTILMKGAELLGQLAFGLIQAIPTLIANIPQIIQAIVDTLMAFQWLSLGKNIIKFLADGIKGMATHAKDAGKTILNAVKGAIQNLPTLLRDIGRTAMSGFSNVISTAWVAVKNAAGTVADAIIGTIKSVPGKMISIGKNIIRGLWNGISDMTGWIIDKIGGFADNVVNKICDFFGINSPSTVMRDEVGRYLAQGMGVGFETNIPITDMKKAMENGVSELSYSAELYGNRVYSTENSVLQANNYNASFDGLGEYIVSAMIEYGNRQREGIEKGISKMGIYIGNRQAGRAISNMGFARV